MENNYTKAYKEIIEILNFVPKESVDKIPKTMIENFKTKMDKDYYFAVDINKSFEEQGLLDETKAIFANIFRDYWATSYQKERIEAKERYDRQKLEEAKLEKYNPDNIFKKKENVIEKTEDNINLPIETKFQEIEEKIAQKSGKSIEDVRKEYDRIIKTSDKNKDGKELYMLRKITSNEIIKGYYKNKGRYSIYTEEGEYTGFIDLTISNTNKANEAEIEYESEPKQRNNGNITISIKEVLADIFINNSFDNLTVRDIFKKTKIGEVLLSINSDNYASQAVANKIGFQRNDTIYIMTREQFLQRTQIEKVTEKEPDIPKLFTSQEIGRTTINVDTEEKDKTQQYVRNEIDKTDNEIVKA